MPLGEFLVYQTENGRTRVECRFADRALWLTQAGIAELLASTPQNVTPHLRAIFAEGELTADATCKEDLQVRGEGGREMQRRVRYQRLEAILAVGYRVRSVRGTQFQRWATERLGEYLRTIFKLNKRYGFTKFVMVVPSVAIKGGVYRSPQIIAPHFRSLYSSQHFEYFL